jgi:hypothetical protein
MKNSNISIVESNPASARQLTELKHLFLQKFKVDTSRASVIGSTTDSTYNRVTPSERDRPILNTLAQPT